MNLNRLIENYLYKLNETVELDESKADQEKFIKAFGKDRFDEYQKLKPRMSSEEFVDPDTGAVITNPRDILNIVKYADPQMLDNLLSAYKNKKTKKDILKEGTKLVYNKNGDKIYHVTTPEAMQYMGMGTTWCIAGKYPEHENEQMTWWNTYLPTTDGGYYVIVLKDNTKYCVQYKDGKTHDITNMYDPETGGNTSVLKLSQIEKLFSDDIYNFFNLPLPIDLENVPTIIFDPSSSDVDVAFPNETQLRFSPVIKQLFSTEKKHEVLLATDATSIVLYSIKQDAKMPFEKYCLDLIIKGKLKLLPVLTVYNLTQNDNLKKDVPLGTIIKINGATFRILDISPGNYMDIISVDNFYGYEPDAAINQYGRRRFITDLKFIMNKTHTLGFNRKIEHNYSNLRGEV